MGSGGFLPISGFREAFGSLLRFLSISNCKNDDLGHFWAPAGSPAFLGSGRVWGAAVFLDLTILLFLDLAILLFWGLTILLVLDLAILLFGSDNLTCWGSCHLTVLDLTILLFGDLAILLFLI